MRIWTLIKDFAETTRFNEDHSDQEYIPDDGGRKELAIRCSGYYTVDELRVKLHQLTEANGAYRRSKE